MLNINRPLQFFVLFVVLTAVISCNDSVNMKAPTPVPADTAELNKNADLKTKITIKSADGNTFAEISPNGQINFGGKNLTKRQKNPEKVIYSINGKEFVEVKSKDTDGFKVRDLNGELLWKIKIKDDKIKISDNEENENPFEIKRKEDGLKIVQNETELGKVKFDSKSKELKVKDAGDKEVFVSSSEKNSTAFGVLLLDKIPEQQRLVIISELFSRNL